MVYEESVLMPVNSVKLNISSFINQTALWFSLITGLHLDLQLLGICVSIMLSTLLFKRPYTVFCLETEEQNQDFLSFFTA